MQILKFKPFAASKTFEFKDPDTGYQYHASTMQQLIYRIISYRLQNNLPLIEELTTVIENYLCYLPINRSSCEANPVMNRSFLSYLKGGIALLVNMAYKKYASQEEADRRGAICVECPHNVFPDKVGFIKWSDEIAEKSIGKRRSVHHDKLGNCGVCSCPLRAKVFFNGEFELTKEQIEEMEKVGCWQPPFVEKPK